MAANALILVFLILITWLLYRFRLKTLTSFTETGTVFAVLAILFLFFIANTLFAFVGYRSLRSASMQDPIQYASDLDELPSGQFVIVSGAVSRSNPAVYSDYVAYQDTHHLWVPSGIIVDLEHGTAFVSNDTFAARGWPIDALEYSYLKPGQRVMVVGHVEWSTGIWGADKGNERVSIRAEIVFAGTPAQFASSLRWKSAVGLAFVTADLAGTAVVLIIGITLFIRLQRAGQNPSTG
ncbi:hypothetical protein JXA80_13985 [bacterium]|nr:hypothetical protein [candidate division CSSED10-310 bacterium]